MVSFAMQKLLSLIRSEKTYFKNKGTERLETSQEVGGKITCPPTKRKLVQLYLYQKKIVVSLYMPTNIDSKI